MEIISAASSLRQQLIALHNSDVTITQLENEINALGQRSVMSVVEDNQSRHLRQVLRLSVNEGVSHMYKQYSNNKWAEVQSTARSIKSSLESVDDTEQTAPVMTSSPPGGRTSQDKAADVWTSVFCEYSRYE